MSVFEWSDFAGALGPYNYTGSSGLGSVGTVDTPLFDNEGVSGLPIGSNVGSFVINHENSFATGIFTFHFYAPYTDYLVSNQGFYYGVGNSSGRDNFGIPLGGTGRWSGYTGFITNKPISDVYESPYVIEYRICSL
jgi:hypothetical protein